MKTSFAVTGILFLLSSAAFACTDLSGQYTCTDNDGTSDVTVQQSAIPGGAHFVFTTVSNGTTKTMDFLADAKSHPLPDENGQLKGTYVANCTANGLVGTENADFYDNGKKVAHMDVTLTAQMQGSKMVSTAQGKVTAPNGSMPINSTSTCVRK